MGINLGMSPVWLCYLLERDAGRGPGVSARNESHVPRQAGGSAALSPRVNAQRHTRGGQAWEESGMRTSAPVSVVLFGQWDNGALFSELCALFPFFSGE